MMVVAGLRGAVTGETELLAMAIFAGLGVAAAGGVATRWLAGVVRADAGRDAGGGGSAAEPDQHGRPAQHRDQDPGTQGRLRDVPGPDPAHPPAIMIGLW